MRTRWTSFIRVTPGFLLTALVARAAAQPVTLELMPLPQAGVTVVDVSADGSVVVGTLSPPTGQNHGFIWSGGMVLNLPAPTGSSTDRPLALSRDGQTVLALSSPGPYLWRQDTGIVLLSSLPDASILSTVTGMFPDGEALFGTTTGISPARAWVWTVSTGIRFLPDLPGGTLGSWTQIASPDGRTVFGRGSTIANLPLVAWRDGQAPSLVVDPQFWGVAAASSFDGSIVAANRANIAYRLSPGQTQALNLPTSIQRINIGNMSDDGSRIVGTWQYISGSPPDLRGPTVIWDAVNGTRNLTSVLQGLGVMVDPWVLQTARISGDGTAIVGQARDDSLRQTAFRIHFPNIPCYANCDHSDVYPALNVNDFMCFLNKFSASDPSANCDQSTSPPVLNVNDFQCFLNLFSQGCS